MTVWVACMHAWVQVALWSISKHCKSEKLPWNHGFHLSNRSGSGSSCVKFQNGSEWLTRWLTDGLNKDKYRATRAAKNHYFWIGHAGISWVYWIVYYSQYQRLEISWECSEFSKKREVIFGLIMNNQQLSPWEHMFWSKPDGKVFLSNNILIFPFQKPEYLIPTKIKINLSASKALLVSTSGGILMIDQMESWWSIK